MAKICRYFARIFPSHQRKPNAYYIMALCAKTPRPSTYQVAYRLVGSLLSTRPVAFPGVWHISICAKWTFFCLSDGGPDWTPLDKHQEAQKSSEKLRKTPRSSEKLRGVPRGSKKLREVLKGSEKLREAPKFVVSGSSPFTTVTY